MVHKLRADYENSIGNYNSEEIGETLNGGSKISRIMHKKFSSTIAEMTLNNKQLRKKIKLAILNIRG